MRADITAGLAVRTLNNVLTEIVIAVRGQKKELAAMLTTLEDKALTKPTEEIKVEERRQTIEGIDIAPHRFVAELDALTYECHRSRGLDDPSAATLLDVFFIKNGDFFLGQISALRVNVPVKESAVGLL